MATYYTNWSISNSSTPNGETYIIDGQSVTYYNDVRYKFAVTESVNKTANTSTFTINKYAVLYYTWPDTGSSLSITCKSQMPSSATAQSNTKTVSPTSNISDYTLIGTDSWTISHNQDGSGTTSFKGTGTYTGGSGTVYTRTVTRSIAMTKIPQISAVANNTTSSVPIDFGNDVTFTITPKISSYTHKLTYVVSGTTYTIAEGLSGSSAFTQAYTFPTSLIASYPNNSVATITVTCTTLSGTSVIGTTSTAVYVSVPTSYVPTVSLALGEGNTDLTSNVIAWNLYIQNKSKIAGTITANGVSGSTINSYLTNGNSQTFNTSTFLSGFLKDDTSFITSVNDSRNRTASVTKKVTCASYISPTITNVIIERCDSTGTINEEGTYGKTTVTYEVSPISYYEETATGLTIVLENPTDNQIALEDVVPTKTTYTPAIGDIVSEISLNSKSITITVGSQTYTETPTNYSGSYTMTNLISGLSQESSYSATITLVDELESASQNYIIAPMFMLESNGSSGKNITYGRLSNETTPVEGIDCYLDTYWKSQNNYFKRQNIGGTVTEKYGTIYIRYIGE